MSRPGPRILVVGSTMVDLVAYADPLPAAGETVVGRDFRLGFGGKGANQAVMAARLGADVAFVNRVGGDLFGEQIVQNLTASGIDVHGVRPVPELPSGVAPIWVEDDGTNRIIVIPGANAAVTPDVVADELDRCAPAACVICQLEISQEAIRTAFAIGREWGATTILNPAPAEPLGSELAALIDWLIPNESEFDAIFGRAPEPAAVADAAREWCRCGLIVTLGARGAMLAAASGDVEEIAAPAVDAVDTTGAGDAFVGGFAYGLATGLAPREAVELANACGAVSVRGHGTQTSFGDAAAVAALLA